jgi:uncharacterized protein
MNKALKIALCLLLVAILPIQVNAQFLNAKTVNIKAVAVKSGPTPEGAVIDITVTVTNGSGKVFVSTTPYTEIDMQGSAQLAALTACDILGLDFTKYDFFYEIKADAPIVGGPSAGAVMTIATIAALKNLSIRHDVFMTGMIYPDGYIGPVGGIPYKLEAAAKAGAKIFLIPQGQRVVYVQEKVEEQKGPFVFITVRTKPVDLVEYGKKLGVEVKEVSTIEEALWYYTGYTISKPKLKINLAKYSDILKILAVKMKKETLELRNKVGKNEKADKLIAKAEKDFERGYYYTATSEYFQAKIELRKAYYMQTIKNSNDLSRVFDELSDELKQMKEYLQKLENEKLGVESFQLIGAGEERIAWAEKYLEKAKTSGDFYTAIDYLALAKERLESAKVWLSLLQTIEEDIPLDKAEVKKRAEFYFRTAQSLIVYASSIHGYSSLIDYAEETLSMAQELYEEGFYSGAEITCMDAIVKAGLAVELIAPQDVFEVLIDSKLESAKSSAETAIAEVEGAVTPILPIAYYEFAKSYEEDYKASKNTELAVYALTYYKLSERLAKLMLFASKAYHEREIVKAEIPPFTPKVKKEDIAQKIEHIEVPGFEAVLAVLAVVIVYYKRKYTR